MKYEYGIYVICNEIAEDKADLIAKTREFGLADKWEGKMLLDGEKLRIILPALRADLNTIVDNLMLIASEGR